MLKRDIACILKIKCYLKNKIDKQQLPDLSEAAATECSRLVQRQSGKHTCVFFRRQFLSSAYEGHKLKRVLEQRWTGHLESVKVVMETDLKYWLRFTKRAMFASISALKRRDYEYMCQNRHLICPMLLI